MGSYTDQRNVLVLSASQNLFDWTVISTLLTDDTGFAPEDSIRYTGFHYVDWQFDGYNGSTLLYAIRTAYRGANSYHNSNRMTVKFLPQWRDVVFSPSAVTVSGGLLQPVYEPQTLDYVIQVPAIPAELNLTVTSNFAGFSIDQQPGHSGQVMNVRIAQNNTRVVMASASGRQFSMLVVKPSLPQPPASLTASGTGFRIARFCEGCQAFSDRNYVFHNVPMALVEGFNFTMVAGGATNTTVEVKARSTGLVVAITAVASAFIGRGWDVYPAPGFCYTDAGSTSLQAFTRPIKADEQVSIPQQGWAGSFVLLSL